MGTPTIRQSEKKALKRRERITKVPLALGSCANDSPVSRLELLPLRKVARIIAKASAGDSSSI